MTFSFDPVARVTLDDNQEKAASKLEEGDKLLIWMPESSIGLYAKPDPTQQKHFALVSDDSNTEQEH